MALNFGLSESGFISPTYQEILYEIEDDFQTRFGEDIPLTSNSNFGILARLMAWRIKEVIDQLQAVYYSAYINTATENALDYLGSNIGLPRKVATPATAEITIKTEDEYLIQNGEQFETENGIIFDLIKDVVTTKKDDGTWSGTGTVQSEDVGAFTNVEAGKITVVSNPDENIISVTNVEKAGGGQDYETDEEYRLRLIEDNNARPGPTESGIKSALRALPGVRQVNIVDNDKADTDEYGNPPYSVHVYVLGGNAQEIAKTLVEYSAVGITMTGSENVKVVDATGQEKMVQFDFAQDKPIYSKVQIETNSEYNVDDGVDAIKEAVAEYINSLTMGQTIHITKMYKNIYAIPGIENAEITIGSNSDEVAAKDIKLNKFEAPSCAPENVEVDIDGVHN